LDPKFLHSVVNVQGTIVEWTASVGQAVKPDDVIALVETDKVTVEIKAELSGVIMQQFGAV
jgi:2-oxoglutarate dehydrogenase E2 component (dihydrolipoamide succinyltransferase)